MKRRIGLWALIGFVVACSWVVFAFLTAPNLNLGRSAVAAVTAPASLIGRSMPLTFYWFILLNAGAYAVFGLLIELVLLGNRRRLAN